MKTKEIVKIARGEKKAELVLKNCQIVNVFSGKIEQGNIAIQDDKIVGIGDYSGIKEIDLKNQYVAPGFIDGHVHIESSLLTPSQFSKVVLPKGTTTVIADPHEIANVCGIDGIKYMLKASKQTPLDVYIMLPSCVPSTKFENSGSVLDYEELVKLKDEENILGLGEMMNFPGVILGEDIVHEKLSGFRDRIIDGHAPDVSGKELDAYIAAGVETDHECTTVNEMEEKLGKGMYIHIREGSATRNLKDLIKGVTLQNSRRILFCTDDKQPYDIKREGHINYNVKLAIEEGIDPVMAIQMASLNIAECYGLKRIGAIAPGYQADFVVFDDLKQMSISKVYKKGKLVAEDDQTIIDVEPYLDENVLHTIHIKDVEQLSFDMPLSTDYVKVIQLIDHNIVTKKVVRKVDVKDGMFEPNDKLDILKMAVIERHKNTGNIGLGLVEGYGLKNGAMALSVAHDSHNIIVIGDNDNDMRLAVKELNKIDGGVAVCSNGEVLHTLRLEVAGLMTNSSLEEVELDVKKIVEIARDKGVSENIDPILTLAFLALPVIPDLKLTDCGLFDVSQFTFVDIEED
jgi:adenine deaminase